MTGTLCQGCGQVTNVVHSVSQCVKQAKDAERSRIVAYLREEAKGHATVVETMLQSEYRAKLSHSWERWSDIARHAHAASRFLMIAESVEDGDHENEST